MFRRVIAAMISDFSGKCKNYFSNNAVSFQGSELDFFTSQFGLFQLIKTYIFKNSKSCINVIFTYQRNIVIDSGVESISPRQAMYQGLI